jgi:hypothetical protein
LFHQKHRYKRLRRIQDEDSDQEPEDETLRREVIAENLFATGSDDVSYEIFVVIPGT